MIKRKHLEAALTVLASIALVIAILIVCGCTLHVDRNSLDVKIYYPWEQNATTPEAPASRPAP